MVNGNPTGVKKRFITWTEKYLLQEKHANANSDFGHLNSTDLYKIRNSLIHYAGLPNLGFPICIMESRKSEIIKRFPDKDQLVKSLVITPDLLYRDLIAVFINTLEDIINIEEHDKEKFDNALNRLYTKPQKDGAMRIRHQGTPD